MIIRLGTCLCIHAGPWYFCADVSVFILIVFTQKLLWKIELKKKIKKEKKRGQPLGSDRGPASPFPLLASFPRPQPARRRPNQPRRAHSLPSLLSAAHSRAPPLLSLPHRTRRGGALPFLFPVRNRAGLPGEKPNPIPGSHDFLPFCANQTPIKPLGQPRGPSLLLGCQTEL